MATFEFYGDYSKNTDNIMRNIILNEYHESLIAEGFTESDAKMQTEMMEFELFNK